MRKIAVFDLDHTLLDTDLLFNVDLRTALARFAPQTDEIWDQSTREAVRDEYSLERHIRALVACCERGAFSEEKCRADLAREFANLQRYLYEDVERNLVRAKNCGWELALLSFGNPPWQNHKVVGSGLARWFGDKVFFTATHGTKADVLAQEFADCQNLMFVDNRGPELDRVQEKMPHVATYHICRVPPEMSAGKTPEGALRYLEARAIEAMGSACNHIRCTTLDSLSL